MANLKEVGVAFHSLPSNPPSLPPPEMKKITKAVSFGRRFDALLNCCCGSFLQDSTLFLSTLRTRCQRDVSLSKVLFSGGENKKKRKGKKTLQSVASSSSAFPPLEDVMQFPVGAANQSVPAAERMWVIHDISQILERAPPLPIIRWIPSLLPTPAHAFHLEYSEAVSSWGGLQDFAAMGEKKKSSALTRVSRYTNTE